MPFSILTLDALLVRGIAKRAGKRMMQLLGRSLKLCLKLRDCRTGPINLLFAIDWTGWDRLIEVRKKNARRGVSEPVPYVAFPRTRVAI